MSDDLKKDRADMFKSLFEFFKHLTTLSSGSILLVLALADKLTKSPEAPRAIFRALIPLSVSMVASVFCMAILAFHSTGDKPSDKSVNYLGLGMAASGIGFCGGIALIALAVFRAAG